MFDILIIGGGHAGVEACNIASQFSNLSVGLITLPGIGIASAPCNPSVGGVGKGQVVRELDALGGAMGRLADLSGLQFRTLNESKGYAVQSTRIQIDKVIYSQHAENLLANMENLTIVRDEVESVKRCNDGFSIKTKSSTWNTKKIIFTVGTFLNGKMHTGDIQNIGGRVDCKATQKLTNLFSEIRTTPNRFKTGTPARLNKDTIDYSKLEVQVSDEKVQTFHVFHDENERFIEQKSCYLAHTNQETLRVIRENKERSPMFNGQINAIGARYCPSIEDKAYRYPDKSVHHVFVEPESHSLNTVYPSGLSTSLPKDVQELFINSIVGLEEAKIEVYGYAVEYDVIDTTQLDNTLELKHIPGVYFAGQVNGTSGYEEAAAQGYIAGVNAALSVLGRDRLVLSRDDSYIGVLIEDLISNTRDEPYRLFTARSENRLFIREDNVILRIEKYRKMLQLEKKIDNYIKDFKISFEKIKNLLETTYINPTDEFCIKYNIDVPRRTSIADIIRQSKNTEVEALKNLISYLGFNLNSRLIRTLAISIKYDGYINKSQIQSHKIKRLDKRSLILDKILSSDNISFECKQRIAKIGPTTFGQLRLIEGIRPATLAVIAGTLN